MLSESSATHPDMASRREIGTCPLCQATSLQSIIDRDGVPVLQNRFYPSTEKARAAPIGRLTIDMCAACGFMFNRTFDSDQVTYDDAYENEQGHSAAFRTHMGAMAERVLAEAHSGAACVEIGCGQGRFLRALADQAGGRLGIMAGYDPAWRGGTTPPGIRIEGRAFDGTDLGKSAVPEMVILRHVIEHVPDPIGFLAEIRAALPKTWSGRLFVETPDLQWIIDGGVIFDFFHEHCNYFCAGTLRYALARAGFRVHALDTVFEGQHLWIEAELGAVRSELPRPEARPKTAALVARERSYAGAWRNRLLSLKTRGRVAVWGAGAKGVTFANLVDRNADVIDCLIDLNPAKQDLFIPVSGHLVLGPSAALARGLATVIVMNPNYRSEIEAMLDRRKACALVLDA
jgi:hypothetical protein